MRRLLRWVLAPRAGRSARQPVPWLIWGLAALLCTPAQAVLPIEQWRTERGVKVLFVAAPDIPMLDVEIRFDAGDRLDPPDRIGLAGLTASLLDAGAGTRDEAALAEAFAMLGSQRASWSDDDSAGVRLRTLTAEAVLQASADLLVDMIARPRFDEANISREKRRIEQAIGDALKRPGVLLGRAFAQAVYPDHPYGNLTTVEAVRAIEAADLRRFHREHYVAERATIAMIGAISRARAEALAEQLVAALPAGTRGNALPAVAMPRAREIRIPHPASQSHIAIGMPLLARGDPDYFALLVANQILGGGSFVSRLYREVRDERGLAYSISSGFSLRAQPGPFSISLQTRREKTAEALRVVRSVLTTFVTDGPTPAELEAAQANLAGGFAMSIDSNNKILGMISTIGFNGLPLDYLETWPDRVRAVTMAQVRDAISRRLDPQAMVTVVVGAAGDAAGEAGKAAGAGEAGAAGEARTLAPAGEAAGRD